jgi:hypothetical protein
LEGVFVSFLSGYKTYIVALAAIADQVAMLAQGQESLPQFASAVTTAILAATIRSGISANGLRPPVSLGPK